MWCAPFCPKGFSDEFIGVILRVYVFVKGLAGAIILYSTLPLYRSEYGLSGLEYQTYSTIALLPWTMKPLVGAIVDSYPWGGYKKRNYAVLAVCISALSTFLLFIKTSVNVSTGFLFTSSFGIMMIDLIYEGEYSSRMAFRGGSATMPSFVWSCIMAGSVAGAILVGPLGDQGDIRYAYLFAAICILQLLFSIIVHPAKSFYKDKIKLKSAPELSENIIPNNERRNNPHDKEKILPREWTLCVLMAVVSIVLMTMLFTGSNYPWSTLGFSLLCVVCLHTWAYYVYHGKEQTVDGKKRAHQLWTYNLYMFLVEAFYVNISGAQDFWFTADDTCVTNGPAFSLSLYTTTVTIISAIAGILASMFYSRSLMKWSFRSAVQMAIVFQAASSFTDIAIAKRWNITHLGISDPLFFLLGDAVITPVASMLKLIPMAILTSRIVERGKETMTYSLLAGFQNMGVVFSKIFGLALIQSFEIKTIAPFCSFIYYPALILFAHMIMPMLSFVLAFVMLPPIQQYK